MGIFDLFKKLVKKDRFEEIVTEKLAFSDIEDWTKNKRKENGLKEKEIIDSVKKKISSFNEQLKEKKSVLENFDVESKKVEDRLKSVVNESRKKYIEALEIFMENLNNIEKEKLEEFISYVNRVFLDFDKKSHMNYEKTTILIGKEMAGIRDSLKTFSKELMKIFNENKNIVDLSRSLGFIKLKLNQLNQIDKVLGEIKEEIAFLGKKASDKKEEEKNLLEGIEETKKSPSYLDYLNRQEKIKFLGEEIKKDIQSLRQLIDLKALANFYHIFGNEMNIIKEYKENFEESFRKDNGLKILNLLENSKLNNNKISEKAEHIRTRKEELKENKQKIKGDETQNLNSEKTRISKEIEELNTEKAKEEKRHEKLKISKEKSISALKQETSKLNVEFV
jgi:DNA repair exonuclease SbcCD ATPase subunit